MTIRTTFVFRVLFMLLSTLFSIKMFGQQDIKEQIIGDWSTFLTSGDSGIFHFSSDGSMFMKSPQGMIGKGEMKLADGRVVKPLMRYVLNTNKNPTELDFYYAIDNYFNIVGKAEGIIELLDDNLLRIAMNYNKPLPVRPRNFDNSIETVVISRDGKQILVTGCDKFKEGTFKMFDAYIGTTQIVRDDGIQIETSDLGDKVKLKLDWTSQCTYTLKPIEFYVKDRWIPDTTGIVQTVQIIKTRENSYIFSTSDNKSTSRRTRELFVSD